MMRWGRAVRAVSLERTAAEPQCTEEPVALLGAGFAFAPLTAQNLLATDRVASATRLTSVAFLRGPVNPGPFSLLLPAFNTVDGNIRGSVHVRASTAACEYPACIGAPGASPWLT